MNWNLTETCVWSCVFLKCIFWYDIHTTTHMKSVDKLVFSRHPQPPDQAGMFCQEHLRPVYRLIVHIPIISWVRKEQPKHHCLMKNCVHAPYRSSSITPQDFVCFLLFVCVDYREGWIPQLQSLKKRKIHHRLASDVCVCACTYLCVCVCVCVFYLIQVGASKVFLVAMILLYMNILFSMQWVFAVLLWVCRAVSWLFHVVVDHFYWGMSQLFQLRWIDTSQFYLYSQPPVIKNGCYIFCVLERKNKWIRLSAE